MKIGIITFHRAINYGGILQAFALQRVLENEGQTCEILDYYCPFIEEHYRTPNYLSVIQLKRFVATILYNGEIRRNTKEFEMFSQKYLKISKNKYTPDNLKDANNQYDLIITGSDQVWSPTCAGFDPAYFLCFVGDINKKAAYAASFGAKVLPEKKIQDYRDRLRGFKAISVREDSGKRIVEEITGKNAELVLDPTLLLSKQQWMTFFGKQTMQKKDYILVYMISEDKRVLKHAKELGKTTGKEVVYINDRIYKASGITNYSKQSPDQWIRLFLNASIVLTNSFHGVAFSINFNKQFFAYHLQGKTLANERIDSILDVFDLKNRLELTSLSNIEPINYLPVNDVLNQLKEKSMFFLRKLY